MREFARLYAALDSTTSTTRKLEAMVLYLQHAPPADAAWVVYFLLGGKPRQLVPARLLREVATAAAGIAPWLFEECYQAVGDLAETIALVLPPATGQGDLGLADWMSGRLLPLRGMAAEAVQAALLGFFDELDARERFLLVKLIAGGFRVGVSRLLVTRALATVAGIDGPQMAQRLIGWTDKTFVPSAQRLTELMSAEAATAAPGRRGQPYPFFLAQPLHGDPATLGPIDRWLAEWKYDGIRAQLVRRNGQSFLWSRGEELISDRFPEVTSLALPDGTVIDGEILVWAGAAPNSFADLQQRIGRKTVTPALLAKFPAVLLAYDLLETDGVDIRLRPQLERRQHLDALVATSAQPVLRLSPLVPAVDWPELGQSRKQSRARGVEGLMLKSVDGAYGVGRTTGAWWKWKIDPYSVDAVLVYAQAGHGRRASLYTDYTFAVWDTDAAGQRALVPFAKAYSGLTDAEIGAVDAVIRKTTVEKFGPVRSVHPSLVFEIGFEGIARSSRHKSGVAVRFPRILRQRAKPIEEADTLGALTALLAAAPGQ